MGETARSVVTCDLEGRIQTFSRGAEAVFGYAADEAIGRMRVSAFSPGLIVLGHVGAWLDAARRDGRFETRTVFLRKDGTPFSADIRITPTFRGGRGGAPIGFCGVTVPRPDVPVAEAMPRISLGTRLLAALVVTRAPFLSATVVPVLGALAAFIAARGFEAVDPWAFGLALLGAVSLHLAANVLNDHFDHHSGADPANNDYFQPYSGGSRAIELGLITPAGLLRLGLGFLTAATACGVALALTVTPDVLWLGLIGAAIAVFYTAPPLRLVARKGLGELSVGLAFGPGLAIGTWTVLEGGLGAAAVQGGLAVGVPMGLLIAAILWINEFPDYESDRATGKRNLVVVLGRSAARHGFTALLGGAFASVVVAVALGVLPWTALLALGAAPIAVGAVRILYVHFEDRALIDANAATIRLQVVFGALLAVGLLASRLPFG